MSIGLIIVAHNGIGTNLLSTAEDILGGRNLPLAVKVIDVRPDSNYERKMAEIEKNLSLLDQGDGVLVLTDIFGATPSNIAVKAAQGHPGARVISGINLPMLIRILNYANLPLDKIIAKALNAGHDSIFECKIKNR